jgi:hypothetical protein
MDWFDRTQPETYLRDVIHQGWKNEKAEARTAAVQAASARSAAGDHSESEAGSGLRPMHAARLRREPRTRGRGPRAHNAVSAGAEV